MVLVMMMMSVVITVIVVTVHTTLLLSYSSLRGYYLFRPSYSTVQLVLEAVVMRALHRPDVARCASQRLSCSVSLHSHITHCLRLSYIYDITKKVLMLIFKTLCQFCKVH